MPALAVADALRAARRRGRVHRRRARRGRARAGGGLPVPPAARARASTAATRCARRWRWCWRRGATLRRRAAAAPASRPTRCSAAAATSPGPVGLAARLLRMPLVLTEADSHLGVANRLLAPLARRVFLAFPIEGRDGRRVAGHRPAGAGRARAAPTARRRARASASAPTSRACSCSAARSARARLNEAALEAFGAASPVRGAARLRAARLRRAAPRASTSWARRRTTTCTPTSSRSPTRWPPPTWSSARAGGSVLEVAAAGLASDARALPARDRRPPDAQRALDGARPARRWWCPTPSSTARGWRARSARCWRAPQRLAEMSERRARGRRGPTRRSGSPTSCWRWPGSG